MKNKIMRRSIVTPILLAAVAATVLTLSSSAPGVQPTAGFVNAAPGGGRARFEVKLFRFTVNHETWDDALERDGKRDEVSFSRVAILHNSRTGSRVLSDGLNFTQVRGELKTGDDITLPTPAMLFSEELIEGESAATIIVSAWELDGQSDLYSSYKDFLFNYQDDMQRIALGTLRNSPQTSALVRAWDNSFTGGGSGPQATVVALVDDPPSLGAPKDRPIGMIREANYYNFVPKLLILNFNNASRAADSDQGLGPGVIKINYTDADRLAGNYTLHVRIKRV